MNSIGAILVIGLGIVVAVLVVAGRGEATWAAITGKAGSSSAIPGLPTSTGGGLPPPAPTITQSLPQNLPVPFFISSP